MYKTIVNNWINYQPQLVIAGFLNHQQCDMAVHVLECLTGVTHALPSWEPAKFMSCNRCKFASSSAAGNEPWRVTTGVSG